MYLIEREEFRPEGLEEQSLVAEPHLLAEVRVSVIEVLAECVYNPLKVSLYECRQVREVWLRGRYIAWPLHQTPVSPTDLWTTAIGENARYHSVAQILDRVMSYVRHVMQS